jgi:hypothetical protein
MVVASGQLFHLRSSQLTLSPLARLLEARYPPPCLAIASLQPVAEVFPLTFRNDLFGEPVRQLLCKD